MHPAYANILNMELSYNISLNMSYPIDCYNRTINQGGNGSLLPNIVPTPIINCSHLFQFLLPSDTKLDSTQILSFSEDVQVNFVDRFKWGTIIAAAIALLVFLCIVRCWCSAKQNHLEEANRIRYIERRALAEQSIRPYYIEGDLLRNPRNVSIDIQQPPPPSYVEVIGCFEPPPSYNDAIRVGVVCHPHREPNQVYNNVGVTIDDLPPPFMEVENKSEDKLAAVRLVQ